MASLISKLPEHERQALALCGISQDSQLETVAIEDLLVDLHKAQHYFPEEAGGLTDARVKEIYAMVGCEPKPAPAPVEPAPQETQQTEEKDKGKDAQPDFSNGILSTTRSYPDLAPRHHQHKRRSTPMVQEKQQAAPGRSHSVHCSRPIATYIAALSMVLFYAGLVSMVLVPALLFMRFIESDNIYLYFFLSAFAMLPYAVHGAWVGCSVCNMKFFMLRHYNISRHAHKIPGLEWATLPTALHIIFCLWYRCPACGTSLRLYRHRH